MTYVSKLPLLRHKSLPNDILYPNHGFHYLGAILTSSATSVTQYGIARMASALGAQGLQLAQMIIVADTSSLSSRALLTSTISSPWIITTWIGPVIGARFRDMGEVGYRAIYGVYGVLVPMCALWLAGVLFWKWRQVQYLRPHDACDDGTQTSSKPPDELMSPSPLNCQPHQPLYRRRRSSVSAVGEQWAERKTIDLWKETWTQLDTVGILLLTIGCGMILLPLTLNNQTAAAWGGGEFDHHWRHT